MVTGRLWATASAHIIKCLLADGYVEVSKGMYLELAAEFRVRDGGAV